MDRPSVSGCLRVCKIHSASPPIQRLEDALASLSSPSETEALEAMDESYYVLYHGAIQSLRRLRQIHIYFDDVEDDLRCDFPDCDAHVAPSIKTAGGLAKRSKILASLYELTESAQTALREEEQLKTLEAPELCACALHLAVIFSLMALQHDKGTESHTRRRILHAELLTSRAKLAGFEKDLDHAVTIYKELLALAPRGMQALVPLRRYLESLLNRYDSFRNVGDLDATIILAQPCVDIVARPARDFRVMLCKAYSKRFASCGDPKDLKSTLSAIKNSLLATVWDDEWDRFHRDRLEQARGFLALIFRRLPVTQMEHEQGVTLLEVYRLMLRLPYRMMEVGADLHLGLPGLVPAQGLASEVFEHALLFSSAQIAVEMLEKSRDVFWTQTLRLRSSFDGLPRRLSKRLRLLAPEVETRIHSMFSAKFLGEDDYQEALDELRTAQGEFHCLAEQARTVKGFERFMMDPELPFSSLAMAAEKGPVVILAVTAILTNVVIIRSPTSGAQHMVLRGMSLKKLGNISNKLADINARSRNGQASDLEPDESSRAGKPSTRGAGSLLDTLWREVVGPVINALGYQKAIGRNRPRIWWCPTGSFMTVPLHAAGEYSSNGDCCSDYVVSSYTRSLRALSQARQSLTSIITSEPKALLVAEANAPKLNPLPNVTKEIAEVKSMIPSRSIIPLAGDTGQVIPATAEQGTRIQQVVDVLPQASIVHLACHGTQHGSKDTMNLYASDALQSGFCLRDGDLKILHFLRLGMPKAFFAFLSACESAKGDETQSDESVHMAAAMMFCGFRSVVATMWSMDDLDGPEVAKTIYKELFKGSPFDPDDVPYALDAAVQSLRARKLPPSRWATYIHMGV